MEVYEAKYDYVKERDDVLSFSKGEKFYITNKTNDKWWAAKRIEDNAFGYVPSVYLKPSAERVIGRLVPEGRRDTEEHKIHLRALAEIHKKVKPLPVSPPPMISPPPPDYDVEDESTDKNDMPFHHKLNSSSLVSLSSEDSSDLSPTSPPVDDAFLIKPKPLPNPVKDSKEHKNLHRELRLSYKKDGGPLPQKSELSIVQRERKLEERKRELENEKKAKRTSMELKLQERQEKERKEEEKAKMKEQEAIKEESKPEFLKVRLKQTNSIPKS